MILVKKDVIVPQTLLTSLYPEIKVSIQNDNIPLKLFWKNCLENNRNLEAGIPKHRKDTIR